MKWVGNQKAFNLTRIAVWLWAVCLLVAPARTPAFALLGPVQPWMQKTDCVLWPDDIGGPMELGSEYRWNVPVVTYGFDQSFLDYFGTNGVAAVESAIKILNDLPPASSLELTNYPLNSLHYNSSPQAQHLCDLKSQTLSRLVEQLGLASPTRYVYVLHDWDPVMFNEASGDLAFFEIPIYYEQDPSHIDPLCWSYDQPGNLFFCIAGLNFSPETLETSLFVNENPYAGEFSVLNGRPVNFRTYPLEPSNDYNAVADNQVYDRQFFSGLSRDDVGGLRYLLSATNLNYEMLLFDVQGVDGQKFVNYAWRPGVEKITFVPQPKGALPGTFLPMTNLFTDTYMVGRDVRHQQLQRVTWQPDFLFSTANDWGIRTGTWNWVNFAALNNNIAGTGPGIIEPPVVITFPKMGIYHFSETDDSVSNFDVTDVWGSFDGSTNAPIVYPVAQTGTVSGTVRMPLRHSISDQEAFHDFEWTLTSPFGTVYAFQTSTNLTTWSTLFMLTNNGSVCTFQNSSATSRARFYRLMPE